MLFEILFLRALINSQNSILQSKNHHLIKFIFIKLISILLIIIDCQLTALFSDFWRQSKNRILTFVHNLFDYAEEAVLA